MRYLSLFVITFGLFLSACQDSSTPVNETLNEGNVDETEIFKVVEQMPRFPGCEDMGNTNEEKAKCAEGKMLEYIFKNLKYPAIARENRVEGMTVIQFMVSEDGSIKDANIVREIGGGCGDAALRVVQEMNNLPEKWTPGKQRGRNVKVLYTIPVRFKLEG